MFTQNQLEALIEQFVSSDDSDAFPIREHVRESIAKGLTFEDTAAWLEEETKKRFPDLPQDLPWERIALHFHQDVTELMAYEQAHDLEMKEEMRWGSGYVLQRHEDRVTLWIDAIEDSVDVPITKSMPEWMLAGREYFTTTYPRRFRRQRTIPSDFVAWGPFELLPGKNMTEEELLDGIAACFSADCIVTYRCGHQEQVTLSCPAQLLSLRIAEHARLLCHSCQITPAQRQFEESIEPADESE